LTPPNFPSSLPTSKIIAAADRAWEATQDGVDEMHQRLQMKRYEKQMAANRIMLEVMNGEARNNY
jgi:hypothetical protein